MKGRVLALKRINKDMKEITQFPIEGIGIAPLDNDGMKYVVNIRLMMGLYAGYCVQLLLTFSDNYPSKPPKILIYPGQAIDGQYHHHIFYDNTKDKNGLRFKKFCFDLLDNDFMSTNVERSGWNPSYSISSLLLQVQNFIADPDMPKEHLPNKNKIEELMSSMNNYERIFEIEEGDQIKKIKHTWKNPFPEMHMNKKEKNEIIDINEQKEDVRLQQIKENLTCFMLKLNYIDDPEILLGYPIIQKKGKGKEKIELFPIPELLTYDGYIAQIQKQEEKLDFYFDTKFKSANNQFYNYWMPIYIDEKHYLKNKTTILNALSVIKYGPLGIKQHNFQTEQIFEILPIILNKMIIGMFNGQSIISSAFIMCYFHFILLFKKLCEEYEKEYIQYLNNKMNIIHRCKYNIKKKVIPDIGNFLVLLLFCHKKINNKYLKKMWYSLYEEFLLRQIFWIFYNEYRGDKILNKIILTDEEMLLTNKINELKKLSLKSGYLKIKDNEKFLELLHKKKLYNKIIEIINKVDEIGVIGLSKNSKSKINMNKIKENLNQNFNAFFESLEANKKRKIINLLIDQEEFYELFEISNTYINRYKISPKKERLLKIKKLLYNNNTINAQIKNEFLKYAFDSQIGNKLLLITFIAKKTIEKKEFMEQLENNYGVYLDVDNFIKKMKNKLNEIKNYKQLFEYLESDFGKNKNNLEIIRDAYEKAKLKGYIENDKFKKKKVNKDNNKIKEKKEKKATVNFDDDINEEYIEHYSDDDYYENEGWEESEEIEEEYEEEDE